MHKLDRRPHAFLHPSAPNVPQREARVIAFSSGNHAQGIALAAREMGIPATIVMPQDAPATKVAARQGHGATVVFYDRYP